MDIRTAAYDLDNSLASRELVARFAKSGYFDIVERVDSDDALGRLIDRGEASARLKINHGFADDLRAGRTAQLQVVVGGTDSNTAGVVLDYSAKIAGQLSRTVLLTRFTRVRGSFTKPGRVKLQSRTWFNEN